MSAITLIHETDIDASPPRRGGSWPTTPVTSNGAMAYFA